MAKSIKPAAKEPHSSPEKIRQAVAALYYLSESEAPLELPPWPEVKDLPALQQKIEGEARIPIGEQTIQSPEDFLTPIHQMASPQDKVMTQYAADWDALFALLKNVSEDIKVVQAGIKPVQIYIAAFGEEASVIIHTTATET